MYIRLSVCSELPYDLVLGWDWLFFCSQTLPHASFSLSSESGVVWCLLIAPHKKLVEGTLVMAKVSFMTYLITNQKNDRGNTNVDKKVCDTQRKFYIAC
jgi:hypothetical protein